MKQRRKCQECGNVQYDKLPPVESDKKMSLWLEHKCKKCGSIGLDYGQSEDHNEEANNVRH